MQLRNMPVNGASPETGLRLSCSQFTAPSVTLTVIAANVAPAEVPKRSSLPSRFPRCWSTGRPATAGVVNVRSPPGAPALGIEKVLLLGCAVRPGFGLYVSYQTL